MFFGRQIFIHVFLISAFIAKPEAITINKHCLWRELNALGCVCVCVLNGEGSNVFASRALIVVSV